MNMISEPVVERRQHYRLSRPQLYLRHLGHVFHTVEWSYGGFVVEDKTSLLPAGALLTIDGLTDEDTYRRGRSPFTVDIRARVMRVLAEQKQAALTCLKLDDAAYRILNAIENGTNPARASPAGSRP